MNKKRTSLWFAKYNERYKGYEPFYIPTEKLAIAQLLELNAEDIIREMKMLWQYGDNKLMKSYHDDKLQFPPLTWRKLVLKVCGISNKSLQNKFPITASIINSNPNIISCFVSRTAPHSSIKPHCGETNANIRIHLGLEIPHVIKNECGIQVGDTRASWSVGKSLAFLDAHEHFVWNETNFYRYILIVDIIRPKFAKYKDYVCARIVVNQLYYMVADKLNATFLYKTPGLVLAFLAAVMYLPYIAVVYLNERLGFLRP